MRKQSLSSTTFLENAHVISQETNPNLYSRARFRDTYRKSATAKYRLGSPTIKAIKTQTNNGQTN